MTPHQRNVTESLDGIIARANRVEGLLTELCNCTELNMDDMEDHTRELLKRIMNVLKQPH